MLDGKIFQRLATEHGFEREQRNNKYYGLKGTYCGYFFRIFYDWNTTLPGRMFTREIRIMMHVQPPIIPNKGVDVEFLKSIESKHDTSDEMNPNYELFAASSYIAIRRGYTVFTTYQDIVDKLDQLIQIAMDEKLQPIEESWIEGLIKNNDFAHGPLIETFWSE